MQLAPLMRDGEPAKLTWLHCLRQTLEGLLLIALFCAAIVLAVRMVGRRAAAREAAPKPSATAVEVIADNDSTGLERAREDTYDEAYWFPVESVRRSVAARVKLRYQDSRGTETERTIDVHSFSRGETGVMFEGFDHLRNARRRLSSKCVLEAIDTETGELISSLPEFLEQKYAESPDFAYDQLFETHGRELYILIYIAAADGAVRAKERAIIVDYCRSRPRFGGLDPERLNSIIFDLYRPTKHEFHKFVRESEIDGQGADEILCAARAIVGTSRSVHTECGRALAYIEKQWKTKLST